MALRKIIGILICTFFLFPATQAQTDSCELKISLLTCSPGEELYSTFGHTAIRVQDLSSGLDYVFNYGTFEFGPDFYTKFIKGQLNYYLSVQDFREFIYSYEMESRSIVEQPLQLTCAEKQQLFIALQHNARPENRYYLYDFLFDNCTTRARDIVAQNTASPLVFPNILPQETPTFRNLIHSYLDLGGQYWSKLGIDILLGAKLDREVTNQQSMFLPDYLKKGFDSAYVSARPLVNTTKPVLQMPSPLNTGSWFRPAVIFFLLLGAVAALQWTKAKWLQASLRTFDFLFFLILGLAGLLLLFMWFGTDHNTTQNNYNLLWALPTHVVMAFLLHRSKDWVRLYFRAVFWLSVALLCTWFFLPQQMNSALIPVLLLILFRSWYLSKRGHYGAKMAGSQQ